LPPKREKKKLFKNKKNLKHSRLRMLSKDKEMSCSTTYSKKDKCVPVKFLENSLSEESKRLARRNSKI